MFKVGKEALYERLLKEKDREIEILADQIDYLRAQLAMRGVAPPGAPVNPTGQPATGVSPLPQLMEVKNHVSDDELDAEALMEDGLSEEQIKAVLEEFGLSGVDNIDIS